MQTGVLLVNLGTPEAPTVPAVRRYLREFLSDPRVLDMPAPLRWLLLEGVILPFRPGKSAAAYAQIWTAEGSPLQLHTRRLAEKLASHLGDAFRVDYAMRYGKPSIPGRLTALLSRPLRELVVLPLYPQYASASTGSSLEAVMRALATLQNIPALRVAEAFYSHPAFIEAMAKTGAPVLEALKPDHVLFSYHGLPERQIRKSECKPGHCLAPDDACCAAVGPDNAFCYRAQCFATSRLLSARLGLDPRNCTTAFQSRLGRTPWIRPFTDEVLLALAQKGVRRLAVFEPSFVADCLETLEEMGIRGAEAFRAAGGERLELVPAPNSSDAWVRALSEIISAP
jgi:ferrochelatase